MNIIEPKLLLPLLATGLFAAALPASAQTLLTYGFEASPTTSKVDPDFEASGVSGTDITEAGDPDGGGSSPAITNFSGGTVNIKRFSLASNSSPSSTNDYFTFTISADDPLKALDFTTASFSTNQFGDAFQFAVFYSTNGGTTYSQAGSTIGGASNSTLANTTVNVDLSSIPQANSVDFRIGFGFQGSTSTGGNTTLQFNSISLNGSVVPEPSSALLLSAGAGFLLLRRRRRQSAA